MTLNTSAVLQNRYRIVRLVAQGGFGAVYRAWDLSLEQPVAVKENFYSILESQRQFEREAKLLAGLRHPNLPRVGDHFIVPGQGQYLVMDFIEGKCLSDLLAERGRALDEAEALPWIRQVCDALSYLHRRMPPIIHRDVKPQNIIVTAEGRAMLVDFGISKVYDPSKGTSLGAQAITPGYSPPEQYGRRRTDARSDVYALGATLYTLLTGQTPPEAPDLSSGADVLIPPHEVNPTVSEATSWAIMAAMVLSMGQRLGDVAEFAQMLPALAAPWVAMSLAAPPIAPPVPTQPPVTSLPVAQVSIESSSPLQPPVALSSVALPSIESSLSTRPPADSSPATPLSIELSSPTQPPVVSSPVAPPSIEPLSSNQMSVAPPEVLADTPASGSKRSTLVWGCLLSVAALVALVFWTATWLDGQITFSTTVGNTSLSSPEGIAVDGENNFYVTERLNQRIQKFAAGGTSLAQWGSEGSGEGQFYFPNGITLDNDGNVYVVDRGNSRVQKFSANGLFLAQWGNTGRGDGQFDSPSGIAVDSDGFVYVADTNNHRIQKFTPEGEFLVQWGSKGDEEGQFNFPGGIAVNSDGIVYVADTNNYRIQKFTNGGAFLAQWGGLGSKEGQFNGLSGVAVNVDGDVYVADTNNYRIQKFTPDGAFLGQWGSRGSGVGQFSYPTGIIADSDGNVYVADRGNNRIQKFTDDGEFLAVWGGED